VKRRAALPRRAEADAAPPVQRLWTPRSPTLRTSAQRATWKNTTCKKRGDHTPVRAAQAQRGAARKKKRRGQKKTANRTAGALDGAA
jgi:hypothetical protein